MINSYRFNGVKRKQFIFLFIFSLIISFIAAGFIVFFYTWHVIFSLHMELDTELLIIINIVIIFTCSIIIGCLILKTLSFFIKKTWEIKFISFEIVINETRKKPLVFSLSQIKQIDIYKTNALIGFNQVVSLKFDIQKIDFQSIDFQIIIFPILSISSHKDKTEFLLFIDYLYTNILESQFELYTKNKIIEGIASFLTIKDSAENKISFIRK